MGIRVALVATSTLLLLDARCFACLFLFGLDFSYELVALFVRTTWRTANNISTRTRNIRCIIRVRVQQHPQHY
eukprot:scaffold418802_cov19-Prasinocladus_malaysianus.AAC.2